jgi:serpin B
MSYQRRKSVRRSIRPLLLSGLVIGLLLSLVSCGTGDTPDTNTTESTSEQGDPTTTTGGGTAENGALLASSDLSRAVPSVPRANVLSAAAAIGAFGGDLYSVLAKDAAGGNLVVSPSSIVTALAMTYAGAVGPTADEMARVLHFELTGDDLHQAFNALDSLLESRSWQGKDADGREQGVLVKTANSLWAQRDLAFEGAFLDGLAANYGAGVRLVDYKNAAEAARKVINDWVAGQTEEKITDLIPQGVLDALTRLVLVNAVYLDATWALPFDKNLTTDGQFRTLNGTVVTTPMMSHSAGFGYAKGNGWQAVELPYVRNELAMLVIVPDEDRFVEVESSLTSGLIAQAAQALTTEAEVQLTMPTFEFRTQAGLRDALRALGMRKAFDSQAADFSGMTRQEALYISDVIHEAYIAVDEEGTEAAAATAVIAKAEAGWVGRTVQMTIDRPFLFALRDRDTGAVLFLGRVTDPTA